MRTGWIILGGLVAALTGFGMVTLSNRRRLLDRIVSECRAQGNINERLSWDVVQACLHFGDTGIGILTLLIGIANMGVAWPRGMAVPVDPAGNGWKGRPAGAGKHFTDHRVGGLGIAHFDGRGSLSAIYEKFGDPVPNCSVKYDFNSILGSSCRTAWLQWAGALVQRVMFHFWAVDYWLANYWAPARGSNHLPEAIINARIRNSASGWGNGANGLSWEEQARYYLNKKPDSQDRTRRQISYCERVRVLLEYR